MKRHGHADCELYRPSQIRRYVAEAELADHEEFGRTVTAMRLAQIDDKSFKKWLREHEGAGRAMRETLSRPAMRPSATQTKPFPDRMERLARARNQLRKQYGR